MTGLNERINNDIKQRKTTRECLSDPHMISIYNVDKEKRNDTTLSSSQGSNVEVKMHLLVQNR